MQKISASFVLRMLLAILFLVCLFTAIYVLPILASDQRGYYPELAAIELPMLFVTRFLVTLFMTALLVIFRMSVLYDKEGAYTERFLVLLRGLMGIGFTGAAGVTGVFFFLSGYGGPGPGLGLMMIGGTLCILIVSVVFVLIHRIIKDAMKYKETYDTTV